MASERSITRARDWRLIREQGRSASCGDLRVRVVERPSEDLPTRLGLRIRAAGPARAVARNRAQRRLRQAFRTVAPPTGVDVVVYADRATNDKTFQELSKCLATALRTAGASEAGS